MKYKIVWKKFEWQKVGRLWLYYFHPAIGDWRYTNLSKYFSVKRQCIYSDHWNKGFRAGKV